MRFLTMASQARLHRALSVVQALHARPLVAPVVAVAAAVVEEAAVGVVDAAHADLDARICRCGALRRRRSRCCLAGRDALGSKASFTRRAVLFLSALVAAADARIAERRLVATILGHRACGAERDARLTTEVRARRRTRAGPRAAVPGVTRIARPTAGTRETEPAAARGARPAARRETARPAGARARVTDACSPRNSAGCAARGQQIPRFAAATRSSAQHANDRSQRKAGNRDGRETPHHSGTYHAFLVIQAVRLLI